MPVPPPLEPGEAVDVLHGVTVPDPYRVLEDGDSALTRKWTETQNALTREVLDALPGRTTWHRRLDELLRADTVLAPQVAGSLVFTLERSDGRDQAVLTVRDARGRPGNRGSVLVDPAAALATDTAAIDWYEAAPGGSRVAVGLSTGGDEQSELRVVETASGAWMPDRIPHTRAASVAWAPDGSQFAYTRYPDPAAVDPDDQHYWRTVWWHRLGDHIGHDELVFDDLPDRTAWPDLKLSADGRWLLLHVALGWDRIDVHLIDRLSGRRTTVIEGLDAVSGFQVIGDELVGVTTLDAPRGRVVRAPCDDPGMGRWETVVPESPAVLEEVVATSRSLLVWSTRSAVAVLDRYDRNSPEPASPEPVPLPEPGSLMGFSGSDERDEAWFSFTSFARPPQLFRWTGSGGAEPWTDPPSAVEPDRYRVTQERYPSTDGTSIGLFLIRGAEPSPDPPTVLSGYGGFAVTMSPAYSPAAVAHVDAGGVWAVAGIRGGSEEGEEWHRAGQREHKQQVFDDFAAAADWLIAEGHAMRSRLAIRGGSNGGLLVTAVLTQRPDLCRAVHAAVPLTDMVRYHRFLIARLWVPELGDPDVAEEFAWLHAYSPYHRVVDGTCYPAVLITTGAGDSRVDPAHARKMAARLQAANSCGDRHPVLLRVEDEAGHGQGKPAGRQADELTDVLSFLSSQLDRSLGSAP